MKKIQIDRETHSMTYHAMVLNYSESQWRKLFKEPENQDHVEYRLSDVNITWIVSVLSEAKANLTKMHDRIDSAITIWRNNLELPEEHES